MGVRFAVVGFIFFRGYFTTVIFAYEPKIFKTQNCRQPEMLITNPNKAFKLTQNIVDIKL